MNCDQKYTCIECEHLYDDTDGDVDERICYNCLDEIYYQMHVELSDAR